jgi:spermidine/putrescine transport system substrate-binding protein
MSDDSSRFKKAAIPVLSKVAVSAVYLLIIALFLYMPLLIDVYGTSKTLNVCAFTETFSPDAIKKFEQKTGVKVNLTYVELDEQLNAKFKVNEGEGYDVINVSDFMVKILGEQGLLQPLDHHLIRNSECVDIRLLNSEYDPRNQYSFPHKWFMYGIVYDKDFFKLVSDQIGLDFIFKPSSDLMKTGMLPATYKVCMLDSPLDSFFFASLYLFGHADYLTNEQQNKVQQLLVDQKQWVECYTLYSIEYFLTSKIVPIALTSSNFVRKMWNMGFDCAFTIPPEGGILVVENLAIPKHSKKTALAHKFIDFMLSDEIATMNSSFYGWASSNKKANESVDMSVEKQKQLFPDNCVYKRLHIPLYSQQMRSKIDEMWLAVGFA